MLAGNLFDLALVDIALPDGNGFTVCTEIKERYQIPVLFLTASGDEASVVTGLNMGADDYITTVSYTHLDVYKRQVLSCLLLCR